MEELTTSTYGSIDYIQTLGLGGGGTSSADGFFPSFSFFISCLITHCELDRIRQKQVNANAMDRRGSEQAASPGLMQ